MRPRRAATFALAGWLFADLLLALAVLLTAASGFGVAAVPSRSPSPSPSPLPTLRTATPPPSITPAPTPTQASIAVTSICRHINVRSTALLVGDGGATTEAVRVIADTFADLNGRSASLVLTFGTAANAARAHDLAHAVNALLKSDAVRLRLGTLFVSAETRDYIFEKTDPRLDGEVWLELFMPPPVPAGTRTEDGCPR